MFHKSLQKTLALAAGPMALALAGCGGSNGEDAQATGAVQVVTASAPDSITPTPTSAPVTSNAAANDELVETAASTPGAMETAQGFRLPASPLRGVGISGGEIGSTMPGTFGHDYIYPSDAEIDYYAAQGFKILRIPFRWERLQPQLNGPLSDNDRKKLLASVNHALARGFTVVLDMHNYARRQLAPDFKTHGVLGTSQLPASAFADAWLKIAEDYHDNPKVWLGLMNEPHDMPIDDWWNAAQLAVTRLRAQGIDNYVVVSGTSWDSAQRWVSSGNAAKAAKLTDARKRIVFEVHQYLDSDASGTSSTCTAGSALRVKPALAWAQRVKARLFFGEIAAAGTSQCKVEYPEMLGRIEDSGVAAGWTAWGAGSWWSNSYPFRLMPGSWPKVTTPTDHMELLQAYLAAHPRDL